MATAELKSSLAQFVTFARSLKGDEKSEAQAFLERFFRALGHGGVIEAGATFEFRVAKKPGTAQLELVTGAAVAGVTDPGHNDPLAFLLALNLSLAAKEQADERITSPGLPLPEAERLAFITDDCIRVAEP